MIFSQEEILRLENLFDNEIKNHSVIINPKKEIYIKSKDIDILIEYNKDELYKIINEFEKIYNYKIINENKIENIYELAIKVLHLNQDPYYYKKSFLLKPIYRYDYLYDSQEYLFIDKQFGYNFFKGKCITKKTFNSFENLLIKNSHMSKEHSLLDIY